MIPSILNGATYFCFNNNYMTQQRVLAISSSRVGNSNYLENAVSLIKNFLGDTPLNIAFVPFASVDSYDDYLSKVREGLQSLPHTFTIFRNDDLKRTIEACDVIMIGGGNTFKLLHDIYENNLFEIIVRKVNTGTPYIGWSAGANITGKSISTTNDMPIIEPRSFKAFNFFPFQINPHYLNVKADGHNGETRDQRLEEFVKLNPGMPVVGLPEGTALLKENNELKFIGEAAGVLFMCEDDEIAKKQISIGANISYLLD
jgi:dipeptidase E